MKILAAILFALSLAATYAGGPVATTGGGEASSCCEVVCPCDLQEAPATPQVPMPTPPVNPSASDARQTPVPPTILVRVIDLDANELSPSVFDFANDAACAEELPLFRRDCALLI